MQLWNLSTITIFIEMQLWNLSTITLLIVVQLWNLSTNTLFIMKELEHLSTIIIFTVKELSLVDVYSINGDGIISFVLRHIHSPDFGLLQFVTFSAVSCLDRVSVCLACLCTDTSECGCEKHNIDNITHIIIAVRSGQVRSECLTCTFRASCCSARLPRAQVPAIAGSSIRDRKKPRRE